MKRTVKKTIKAWIVRFSELNPTQKTLLELASRVRPNAHSPISHFKCGAAVESTSGSFYDGCNVEIPNFNSTTHAEQAANAIMVAREGKGAKIRRIALIAAHEDVDIELPPEVTGSIGGIEELSGPCGMCLAIIKHFGSEDAPAEIIILCRTGEVAVFTIKDALPIGPSFRVQKS